MKRVILVGGTMGVGKSTVCHELNHYLGKSVFLDGDWCWDMHPFVVNDETKAMVMNNICFQLNQFIHCSTIENIIFCWVMHEQSIIDEIRTRLDDCEVISISLICNEETLAARIQKDIKKGKRDQSVIQRSIERLHLYESLDTHLVDVSLLNVEETVLQIMDLL